MELVSDLRRSVARATGASLMAPLVLLAAAAAVMVGGSGGLDSLSSLGQAAAGPELADGSGPVRAGGQSAGPGLPEVARAPITGGAGGSAAAGGPAGSTAAGGSEGALGAPGGSDGPSGPTGPVGGAPSPGAPPAAGGPTGSPEGGSGTPGAGSPGGSPANPVSDGVRGISESLPEPVSPVTNDIVDAILGPRGGR